MNKEEEKRPAPPKWFPRLEETRRTIEKRQKDESNRTTSILDPILRPYSRFSQPKKEKNPFKRRYRQVQKAGIFAHVKTSNRIIKKLEEFERVEEEEEKREEPIEKKMKAPPPLLKQNSDAETDISKIEQILDNFSRKLDNLELTELPIHGEELFLNNLEFGVLQRTLKEEPEVQRLPIAQIITHKSAWLLNSGDFQDTKDYLPNDPFFYQEEVASNFDAYRASNEAPWKIQPPEFVGDSEEIDYFNLSSDSESDKIYQKIMQETGLKKEIKEEEIDEDVFAAEKLMFSMENEEGGVEEEEEEHFNIFGNLPSCSTAAQSEEIPFFEAEFGQISDSQNIFNFENLEKEG